MVSERPPSPSRRKAAWHAGVRVRGRFVGMGLGLLLVWLGWRLGGESLASMWQRAFAAGQRGSLIESWRFVSRVGPLVVLGFVFVVALAAVVTRRFGLMRGRIDPPMARRPQRPISFQLVAWSCVAVGGCWLLVRAIAGGARVVDASHSGLVAFYLAWADQGLLLLGGVCLLVGAFEVVVDQRSIWRALHVDRERATFRRSSSPRSGPTR